MPVSLNRGTAVLLTIAAQPSICRMTRDRNPVSIPLFSKCKKGNVRGDSISRGSRVDLWQNEVTLTRESRSQSDPSLVPEPKTEKAFEGQEFWNEADYLSERPAFVIATNVWPLFPTSDFPFPPAPRLDHFLLPTSFRMRRGLMSKHNSCSHKISLLLEARN